MAVVDVKNLEGETVGQVELADAVFAAKVNPHVLHETVRWYLAWQRAGTHKTKGRGEVAGSGRKLWRQKGTGRARVGSIRSPLWRKGGTVHGPQPRNYAYRIPRKVLLGGLRSALSAKLAGQKLTVVDAFTLPSHKTKALRQVLNRLDGNSTALVVSHDANRNLELASRNLEGVKLVKARELQPYDVLRHERLILSRDAALKLSAALAGRAARELLVEIEPGRRGLPPPKHRAVTAQERPGSAEAGGLPAPEPRGSKPRTARKARKE